MNPRSARKMLRSGEAFFIKGRPPAPPEDWSTCSKNVMRRCVRASMLFLRYGLEWGEIRRRMRLGTVSRQRVSYLIGRGTKFLIDHRYLLLRKGP